MVKRTLVLLLLQICVCYELNVNLNEEIMKTLNELKTSPALESVLVPGPYMDACPSRCVSTFSRELKNLLRNMTTRNMTTRNMTTNNKYNIQLLKLDGNLMELAKDQRSDDQCIMIHLKTFGKNFSWINKYTRFLKNLNKGCSSDQCSV